MSINLQLQGEVIFNSKGAVKATLTTSDGKLQ